MQLISPLKKKKIFLYVTDKNKHRKKCDKTLHVTFVWDEQFPWGI